VTPENLCDLVAQCLADLGITIPGKLPLKPDPDKPTPVGKKPVAIDLPGCLPIPALAIPFGSQGTEIKNLDITSAVEDFCIQQALANGNYKIKASDLSTVRLMIQAYCFGDGRSFGPIDLGGQPRILTLTSGSGGSKTIEITYTDKEMLASVIEKFISAVSLGKIPTVDFGKWRYYKQNGIDLKFSDVPYVLDGELPSSTPLETIKNILDRSKFDQDMPVWLDVSVCSFTFDAVDSGFDFGCEMAMPISLVFNAQTVVDSFFAPGHLPEFQTAASGFPNRVQVSSNSISKSFGLLASSSLTIQFPAGYVSRQPSGPFHITLIDATDGTHIETITMPKSATDSSWDINAGQNIGSFSPIANTGCYQLLFMIDPEWLQFGDISLIAV
jgi:hypothetical protein